MAYMKTGAVHEAQTRTKVIIAVVLAVLLLVLACVLFVVKNPRAATQLVVRSGLLELCASEERSEKRGGVSPLPHEADGKPRI